MTDVFGANRISVNPLTSGWGLKSIEYEGKDYSDVPIETQKK